MLDNSFLAQAIIKIPYREQNSLSVIKGCKAAITWLLLKSRKSLSLNSNLSLPPNSFHSTGFSAIAFNANAIEAIEKSSICSSKASTVLEGCLNPGLPISRAFCPFMAGTKIPS